MLKRVFGRDASTASGALAHWRAPVIAVLGYAFLLRLLYCTQVELLPEECYYWNYSRHLDFGYLDHPPVVAWLIRLGTLVFGDTSLGVRCGALCCGVVASIFVFRLTRNLFGEGCAWVALLLAQLLPYFFFSGFLMTPDAPLYASWAATLYFLERALVAGRPKAWLWAGLSLGVGMLSKYSIGLLGLSAAVFVIVDAPSRRWLRRWEPYAGVAIAAAVFSPVVIWNAQHEWASFAFQTSRRLAEQPRFSLHKLIGSVIVLMTPTGALAALAVFIQGSAQAGGAAVGARAWRFLQCVLLVPLTVFLVFSLRHEVKLDWTGAPWVGSLPAIALGIVALPGSRLRVWGWLRAAWPPTLLVMALVYGVGLWYLWPGLPGVGYSSKTELLPVGWRDLGDQVHSIAATLRPRYGDDLLIVGMDRYAIASELAFYAPDRQRSVVNTSTAHLFEDMGLMYEQWFPVEQQKGRPLLLVAWSREAISGPHLERHVEHLEPIVEGTLSRDGRLIRHYYYRVAQGYHAAVPVAQAN